MIAGTLAAPYFSKRFGKIKTVILSQLLSVPFLFFLGVTRSLEIAILSFFLRATLMNMAQPLASGILNVAWLSTWG